MDAGEIKRRVGRQAAETLVASGMRLGLGTGSTSFQTELACRELGLPLRSLNDPRLAGGLDLCIDGADEVDPAWRLVKGGGAAMLIEKIVAQASARYAIVVDSSKLVSRLGEKAPVPVELVPEALATVSRAVRALGGEPELRMAVRKDGPVITDHGNFVLDVRFPAFDPLRLEGELMRIPGVLAHGIFTRPVTDLLVGRPDGQVEHSRRS